MKEKTVFQELIIRFKDYFNIKKLTWKEAFRRILLYVCVVVFVFAGYSVVEKYYTDYVTQEKYSQMMAEFPSETEDPDAIFTPTEEDEDAFNLIDMLEFSGISSSYSYSYPESGSGDVLTSGGMVIGSSYLDVLNNRNEDVIGYINIADTNVDYYVLQYRLDNDYYLKRDIDLKKVTAASIFMDYRNRPYGENKNTVLYGHNMRNGSMFATIHKYKDKTFADEHLYITFNTLYEDMVWEVFASYKTNVNFDYIQTSFRDDAEFEEFLKNCKAKSDFKYSADPGVNDRILTLSTCDSKADERFVVQAVLISSTKR